MRQPRQIENDKGRFSIDASLLYEQTFPDPAFVVGDILLSSHLTLLAGKPKLGKTWLALSVAIGVAIGGSVLGRRVVPPGRVIFWEFDDDLQQIHQRLHVLLPEISARKSKLLKRLSFQQALAPLREGGLLAMQQQLRSAKANDDPVALIVLDPYFAIRSERRNDWVTDDYRELNELRGLCLEYGCACVLVHHLRKAASKYTADQVLGSTGITAGVDAWWLLLQDDKKPGLRLLEIRGRSIPEKTLRLGFNATGDVRGLYVAEEGLHALAGPRGEDLLRLLKLEGPKTPTEISVALGQSANSIHQLLLRLRRRRLIVSDQGRYLCSG